MTLKKLQVLILAAVFLLHCGLELWRPERGESRGWRFQRFNIGIGVLNVLLTLPLAAGFVQYLYWVEKTGIGLLLTGAPRWLQFVVTIGAMDAWMYAWHRLNHGWRPLWRFHRFHHRDTHMNATTALRFHVVELWLSYPGKAIVCGLFGITYAPLLLYELLFFSAIVLHHSNLRTGPRFEAAYRRLFASPGLHRIHHSERSSELHSNYGALFSFWDRIFGSFKGDAVGPIRFGVGKEEEVVFFTAKKRRS